MTQQDSPQRPAFDIDASSPWTHEWAARLRGEVADNVLPWWRRAIFDADGAVLGGRANDGTLLDVPRSAVLGTRLLWTFASAQTRLAPDPRNAQAAHRAWDWLRLRLLDTTHGGVFWSVGARGEVVADHKQVYAQAFAIYALTAFHRMLCAERGSPVGADTPALELAHELMGLVEEHARDPLEGGYFEGCTRGWRVQPGARLSDLEPPAPKSMNTSLHVLEAYTELLRCRPSRLLAGRLRELIVIFLERLWLPRQRCFGLFFDRRWLNLTPQVSWATTSKPPGSWCVHATSSATPPCASGWSTWPWTWPMQCSREASTPTAACWARATSTARSRTIAATGGRRPKPWWASGTPGSCADARATPKPPGVPGCTSNGITSTARAVTGSRSSTARAG